MSYIRIIDPEQATGNRADYYSQIAASYAANLGYAIPVPQLYRQHSILEPYLKLGAMQAANAFSKEAYLCEGVVPQLLVNYGIAINSSCFH